MSKEINILIADDHQMFIDGIKSLLRKEAHINFVGEVSNGVEALSFLENNKVDLLITDIDMPEMNGIVLTKKVKQIYPETKVLVLSMHDDKQIISEILLAEAEGYILKNTGKGELTKAIEYIIEGSTHYSKEVLTIMMQQLKKQEQNNEELKGLTERELEILKLIVQEYSTANIAEQLFISPRTVDTHRKHIMQKTQSKTIIGLIKFAFRNGIVN
ncbi:MAG: response regulator transcription factor [Flavobacteriales bacterium]|nr:response regulator transcription factor [Flavobacteriales bacterium]MCB9363789.1 response regulator transcription factor [Flavobacteriales bacterium]